MFRAGFAARKYWHRSRVEHKRSDLIASLMLMTVRVNQLLPTIDDSRTG
jgi:hypothetical protein